MASPTEGNICSTLNPEKSKWHLSAFSVKKLSLNQETSVAQSSSTSLIKEWDPKKEGSQKGV